MYLDRKFLIFLFLLASISHGKASIHQYLCHIFGHDSVSDTIQNHFNQATQSYKINPIEVKQINKCPFLQQFSSFTWAGTWINANEWEKMSTEQKTWESFHEVAHTYMNHPIKQTMLVLGMLGSSIYMPKVSLSLFTKGSTFKLKIISLIFCSYFLIPRYARYCEKEADIIAATKLQSIGQTNIVQQHIDHLKQQKDNSSSVWFNSSSETIEYLQKVLAGNNLKDIV